MFPEFYIQITKHVESEYQTRLWSTSVVCRYTGKRKPNRYRDISGNLQIPTTEQY